MSAVKSTLVASSRVCSTRTPCGQGEHDRICERDDAIGQTYRGQGTFDHTAMDENSAAKFLSEGKLLNSNVVGFHGAVDLWKRRVPIEADVRIGANPSVVLGKEPSLGDRDGHTHSRMSLERGERVVAAGKMDASVIDRELDTPRIAWRKAAQWLRVGRSFEVHRTDGSNQCTRTD